MQVIKLMWKKSLILLLLWAGAAVSAWAEDNLTESFTRQRIAVFPISQQAELTNKLNEELGRFLEIEVIPLKEVEYAIKQAGLTSYDLLNVETAAKIGKDLNADITLFTDCDINPALVNIFAGHVDNPEGH